MPKEIRGVNTQPAGHAPRQMGRMEGPGMTAPEIIRPGKYADGQDRHGTPAGAENSDARKQRYKDGEAHHAAERSSPYPGKR